MSLTVFQEASMSRECIEFDPNRGVLSFVPPGSSTPRSGVNASTIFAGPYTLGSVFALLHAKFHLGSYTSLCKVYKLPVIPFQEWSREPYASLQSLKFDTRIREKRSREDDEMEEKTKLEAAKAVWAKVVQMEIPLEKVTPDVLDTLRKHQSRLTQLPVREATSARTFTDAVSVDSRRAGSHQARLLVSKALTKVSEAMLLQQQTTGGEAARELSTTPGRLAVPGGYDVGGLTPMAVMRESSSSLSLSQSSLPLIIIVPPSASTNVNITNVEAFLNKAEFHSNDPKLFPSRPKEVSVRPDEVVGASRRSFVVIDDISLLKTPEDWARVVACFVLGKTWQFKQWYNNSTLSIADILSKMVAFHVCQEEELLQDSVKLWNVQVVRVTRRATNARYKDLLVVRTIWERIIQHVEQLA
eukprot:PhF_6_TR13163/c0_g1_i1/m.20751/K15175/CDC73; parafibromin